MRRRESALEGLEIFTEKALTTLTPNRTLLPSPALVPTHAAAEPRRPRQHPPPPTCATSADIKGAGASRSTLPPSLRHRHRDWSTPSVHLGRRLAPSQAPDPTTTSSLSIVLQARRRQEREEVVLLGSSAVSGSLRRHQAAALYLPADHHPTGTGGLPPPRRQVKCVLLTKTGCSDPSRWKRDAGTEDIIKFGPFPPLSLEDLCVE